MDLTLGSWRRFATRPWACWSSEQRPRGEFVLRRPRIACHHWIVALAILAVACSSTPTEGAGSPTTATTSTRASGDNPRTGDQPDRTVALHGGAVAQIYSGDRVRIVEADGSISSDSSCGSNGYDYDTIVAFWKVLQNALRTGDNEVIADLMQYPFRWNGPVPTTVETRHDLMTRFDEVFTSKVKAQILEHEPGRAFCRNGEFMAGAGVAWGYGEAADLSTYRIVTINGESDEE